ncbi:MAG: hypothetical protein ACXWMB_06145 [Candidatus Limnocylindria bacterium]
MDSSQDDPNGSRPQPAPQRAGDGGSKPSSVKAVITGLLIVLALVTIMGTTYLSANHAVVAHDLPWGVTGSSPLTTAVQKNISLDVHQYANQSDLEKAADEAKIYGGFVPQTNTLIISVASSLRAPSVMSAAYEKAAKQAGVKLQAKEINKLPSQDPEGVVPSITLFVLLLGGYLGATFAMQRTKTAATHHRVLALFGHAVLAALVIDLLAGPILGAYPDVGSNFWKLWPEFALICCAAAMLAATLQSLIGSMGTLVAITVIVFIGNPSTGGGNGVAFLPPFWQTIGGVLPPRNGLYLTRNTLYLHGNSISQPIIVLGIYVLVGTLLVTILSWERLQWWRRTGDADLPDSAKPAEVIGPDEETGAAAIPAG